jgi:hypothetical protein
VAVSWHIATLVTQAVVVAAVVGAKPTTTITIKVIILIVVWTGIQQFLQPC